MALIRGLSGGSGGGGTEITEISGYAASTNKFSTAVVGHKYMVFMGAMSTANDITNIEGIDIDVECPSVNGTAYSGLRCVTKVIIGTATATEISFKGNQTAAYNNIIWIDLDAQ